MKRIISCGLAILLVFLLMSCKQQAVSVDIDQIVKFEIVDLLNGTLLEVQMQSEAYVLTQQIVEQCERPFKSAGDCSIDDNHLYQIIAFTLDFVVVDIIINSDGTFCSGSKHYVPIETSDKLPVERLMPLFPDIPFMEFSNQPYSPIAIERQPGAVTLLEHDEWIYFSEHVKLNGRTQTVLAREKGAEYEIVFSLYESYGNRFTKAVEYVTNSFEASEESALYFTVFDEDTHTRGLYSLNLSENTWFCLYANSCSNMVIFTDSKDLPESTGWIIANNCIKALKLTAGGEESVSYDAQALDGLQEIDGRLFYDANAKDLDRYSTLQREANTNNLLLTVTKVDAAGDTKVITFRFSTSDGTVISDVQDDTGET